MLRCGGAGYEEYFKLGSTQISPDMVPMSQDISRLCLVQRLFYELDFPAQVTLKPETPVALM